MDAQLLLGIIALLVGVFLGGSGIVGWYLTMRQLQEQRRLEAQRTFRELVLPNILDFLAVVRSMMSFMEARVRVKKGQKAVVFTLKDYKEVESIQEWYRLFRETSPDRIRIAARADKSGLTSLIPSGLWETLHEALTAMGTITSSIQESKQIEEDRFDTVMEKLEAFDDEIRRAAGLDVLETSNRRGLAKKTEPKLG